MRNQVTTPQTTSDQATDALREQPYHLVLLDDDDHTYQYVIELLGRVLGYQPEKAFALACIVDSEGRATIETGGHEDLTRHQRQIHSYGPDPRIPRCRGSMSAILEPAS